MQIAPP
ncbi:hypothetical protein D030_0032A, partial [Vibrio parahaemolyticus AQ3810]